MQNKIIKKNIKKSTGFTLIETLVAIMIFTTSVLALMVVLSNNLSNVNYAKRKLIATFLAQEGVEYMRNMRDTYVLYEPPSGDNGWNSFVVKISDCDMWEGKACYFDNTAINFADQSQPIIDIPIILCPSQICPELKYTASSGKYDYNTNTGVNSGFVRKIEISDVNNNVNSDEIEVISTVYYAIPSGVKSISLKENLFNWIR